jgi:ppGpp synthetase/RelA/SpoT-type nucleotidyltranferase
MQIRVTSKRAINELSERLREGDSLADSDLELLGEHLLAHDAALADTAAQLQSIGLEPTTRLKTSGTIIEKLKRQRYLSLATIQDLAGARVVKQMSLDEQDQVVAAILEIWPDARKVDRRLRPSFGYRAFHLVPTVMGCHVEIQVRTFYQDTWAQAMETLADVWGRGIRYGEEPSEPDRLVASSEFTRRQIVEEWINLGDQLHLLAQRENELQRLKLSALTAADRARVAKMEIDVDAVFGTLRALVHSIREQFEALEKPEPG